jgi:chitodextrinase
MPVKIARSTPRPSFGLRELLVASHISRLASRDAAKSLLSTLVSESSGECRSNGCAGMATMKKLLAALAFFLFSLVPALAASALLTWDPSTDSDSPVDGYHIYRNGVLVGTSATNSYTDTGLDPSTQYTYTVSAFDPAGNESAQSIPVQVTTLAGGGGSEPEFVPLHKNNMAASGCSDSNNGTSPSTPWCTPNHSVVCGDVIVAAPGNYNGDMSHFGTVSNCPSTSGGIDGSGGIYAAVLLCGGSDLTSCVINCATAQCNGSTGLDLRAGFDIDKNYWSLQGWLINGNGLVAYSAYVVHSCGGAAGVTHHVSIINTIVYNGGQGFSPSSCNNDTDPTAGADYVAIVGMLAQNSNFNTSYGICVAAVDNVVPGKYGSALDTHSFWYNVATWYNVVPGCNGLFDGEDFMYDTLDSHGVIGTHVIANSIGYYATRNCMIYTYQGKTSTTPTLKFYNNTCFSNNMTATTGFMNGEISAICSGGCAIPWLIEIYNNILYTPNAVGGNVTLYALFVEGTSPNTKIGAQVRAGAENISKGSATSCGYHCDPGNNVTATTGTNYGQDYYENPNFKNAAHLLNNHLDVPNCAGYVNTTQCLGWNAATLTMTTQSKLDDLTASCAHCAGKGYQLPSTTCVNSSSTGFGADIYADYPPWLKGLVYLKVTGSTITQKADLATKPCGL